jgi:hypothetical protein
MRFGVAHRVRSYRGMTLLPLRSRIGRHRTEKRRGGARPAPAGREVDRGDRVVVVIWMTRS